MAATFVTLGADTAASTGTQITGGANTPSAWVQFTASLSISAKLLWIFARIEEGSAYIISVGTGAAGVEVARFRVVHGGQGAAGGGFTGPAFGPIPVDPAVFASGTRVVVRVEVDSVVAGSEAIDVTLLLCDTSLSELTSYAYNDYGITAGTDSKDTALDPGGTANAKSGTFVEISSSVAADAEWILFFFGNNANAAALTADWLVDIATGAAASEVVKIANLFLHTSTTSDYVQPACVIVPGDVFAGQRVSMDLQCTTIDATDRVISAAMLAISGSRAAGGDTIVSSIQSNVFSRPRWVEGGQF